MTPQEFNTKFQQKIADLDVVKIIYPVAAEVHGRMVKRIFDEGVKGDNAPIGTYSTEAMYASKKQFTKGGGFKAQGKISKKPKFKNGNDRHSMYLAQGYKELREVQGKPTAHVDLTYSGDLRRDFATHLVTETPFVVAKVTRDINSKKIDGLSAKYGSSLFKLTKEEKEFYQKEVTEELTKYFNA